MQYKAHSRLANSQLETALLCNDVSHWLGANLESALQYLLVFNRMCIIIDSVSQIPA